MASATGLIHVDLSPTIGALQIGSLFATFIFGIVTLQTHMYYSTFRDDAWLYKILVAAVWLLEVAHTVGVSYEVYRSTIVNYGRPDLLTTFPVLGSVTAIGGTITLLVQAYFSMRVYKVLPRPYAYIGLGCIFVSFVRCVGSFYLTARAVTATDIPSYRREMAWLITTLLTTGALVDVIIAVSMLRYLVRKREQGLQRMASVVDRLIAYTIRTGLLTSISAVILLITFQTMPANLVWLAFYAFLAKLYSNSLLSALNSRQSLRDDIANSHPSIDHITRSNKGIGMRRDGSSVDPRFAFNGVSQVISIEMKTTTETIQDDMMKDPGPSYRLGDRDRKV